MITYGNQLENSSLYPHMYPAPVVFDLAVGDVVDTHVNKLSRKSTLVGSAKLELEVVTIDGSELTCRVVLLKDTYGNTHPLPQIGDEIKIQTENVLLVHKHSDKVIPESVQFEMFLVDMRLVDAPGQVARVVGGLPMPTEMLTPHDIRTGNWTGLRLEGEGFEEGMPVRALHAYAFVWPRCPAGTVRDDSFLPLVAAKATGVHERTADGWRQAA